jgi:hypothetical protein
MRGAWEHYKPPTVAEMIATADAWRCFSSSELSARVACLQHDPPTARLLRGVHAGHL